MPNPSRQAVRAFVDGACAMAPFTGKPVVGRSPAGIPGHAETGHRLALQQRFESQLGGGDVDAVHAGQQAVRVDRCAQQHGAGIARERR